MNPTETRELMRDIRRIREAGVTILLIEHDMGVVRGICDRVAALDHGTKIAEGSFEEVRQSPAVRRPISGGRRVVLKLTDVVTHYGPLRVLKSINLEVRAGEIVCLLGGDASGKSTTMKTVLGVVRPTAGRVEFEGDRIDGLPTEVIVRRGISLVPEARRIFARMT